MRSKVQGTIDEKRMIQKGDGVVLGVSGGADSVCLLLLLSEMQPHYALTLQVVHVEHGIRGTESLLDAQFVQALCEEKGIPFVMEQVDVPAYASAHHLGTEEAARICRYRVLEEQACRMQRQGLSVKIALAHNANDNAETVLFQMARGSGISGLRGMPAVRGNIIRPLLGITREEIETYLREQGQTYRTDSTNLTDTYHRNRIRHDVMPVLTEINRRAVEHISRSAEYLGDAAEYLARETKAVLDRVTDKGRLDRKALAEFDIFMQREALYAWIKSCVPGARDITSVHIESLRQLLTGAAGRQISLPGLTVGADERYLITGTPEHRYTEEKQKECVTFGYFFPEEMDFDCQEIICAGDKKICVTLEKPEKKQIFPAKNYTKSLCCDNIKDSLVFRTRQTGDYLVVNRQGGTKKLKDYFINEKIPREQRDKKILLCHGHHVLWVVGYRISEDVKVTETSRRILSVRIMEEEDHE